MGGEFSDVTPGEIVTDILDTVAVPSGAAEAAVSRVVGDGGATEQDEFRE